MKLLQAVPAAAAAAASAWLNSCSPRTFGRVMAVVGSWPGVVVHLHVHPRRRPPAEPSRRRRRRHLLQERSQAMVRVAVTNTISLIQNLASFQNWFEHCAARILNSVCDFAATKSTNLNWRGKKFRDCRGWERLITSGERFRDGGCCCCWLLKCRLPAKARTNQHTNHNQETVKHRDQELEGEESRNSYPSTKAYSTWAPRRRAVGGGGGGRTEPGRRRGHEASSPLRGACRSKSRSKPSQTKPRTAARAKSSPLGVLGVCVICGRMRRWMDGWMVDWWCLLLAAAAALGFYSWTMLGRQAMALSILFFFSLLKGQLHISSTPSSYDLWGGKKKGVLHPSRMALIRRRWWRMQCVVMTRGLWWGYRAFATRLCGEWL